MAEEVGLKLKIDAVESAQTVGELKKGIRELNSEMLKVEEGSEAYRNLAKASGEAKEKIKDLREATQLFTRGGTVAEIANVGQTIAGGFAAASGAAALFGANAENIQKQMLKVQASIAIVEGIKSAIAGWESVQRLLNVAMAANPIMLMVTAIIAATAAIVAFINTTDDAVVAAKQYSDGIDEMTKANKDLQDQIDLANIKLAQQTGNITESEEHRLEIQKKYQSLRQNARASFDKENIKAVDEYNKEIEGKSEEQAKAERRNLEINAAHRLELFKSQNEKINSLENIEYKSSGLKDAENEKKKQEATNKAYQERLKKSGEQWMKELKQKEDALDEQNKADERAGKAWRAEQDDYVKVLKDTDKIIADAQKKANQDYAEAGAEELKQTEEIANAKISIATSTANALGSIAQIVGNQSQEAIALQKSLAVIQVAIDTAKAISAVTASSAEGDPYSYAARVAVAVAAVLASIAKAKDALSSAGVPPGVNISVPSSGSSTAPRINNVSQGITVVGTDNKGNFNGNLTSQVVKAYVVESELTGVQKNITSIYKKSKVG